MNDTQATAEAQEQGTPVSLPTKPVFSRKDIKRYVECSVTLPELYPDYDPWVFKFRLKLTKQAEEDKQKWIALSQVERTATNDNQTLNEVCDLLVELPGGFGDLKAATGNPGQDFKAYVDSTSDPIEKETVNKIVEGAYNLYWRKISPVEFRKAI